MQAGHATGASMACDALVLADALTVVDAALTVVGSRGAGGFHGLHVGSTALRVMGRSQSPILFTR